MSRSPCRKAASSHCSGWEGRSCQTCCEATDSGRIATVSRQVAGTQWGPMRNLCVVVLTAVMAVGSTAYPVVTTAQAGSESAGKDLSGRWTGTWTGTGLLMSPREDAVTLHLVQNGDIAHGRF